MVSLHIFYLPRKSPQLFVPLVYIHPKANMDNTTKIIVDTVYSLQEITPDMPDFMDDFNHSKLRKSLSNFHQYVTCPTRNTKWISVMVQSKGLGSVLIERLLAHPNHNVVV